MSTFRSCRNRGYSLIEVMVTIAIISIIATIAIPAYQDYITESTITVATTNANSLRVPLEDYRLDNGTYIVAGDTSYNEAELLTNFGWSPDGDKNAYVYTVTASSTSWDITVEHINGVWVRCENRFTKCCDSESTPSGHAVTAACP